MNKFKVIVLCIVLGVAAGLLAGCSEPVPEDRRRKTFNDTYDIICLNGAQYYESEGSLAPKYSARSNTPDTCS